MKPRIRRTRHDLFRREKRRLPMLPISVVVLAVVIVLLSLISPLQFINNINPASVRVPQPTSTSTALPLPTDVHGGHIVFTCTRKNINQICMINADGSEYTQLTDQSTNTYYPTISPDNKSVVIAVNKYDYFDLYMLTVSNSNLVQLTDNIGNSFSPDFSPDGKQILFVNRVASKTSALWIMDSSGHDPHVLYTGPKDIVGSAWSPDGNIVAFAMAVDLQYTYEIFILDLRTPNSQPRRLTHDMSGIGGSLDWSPDGRSLVLFAGPVAAREVFKLDVATGVITQLTFGGNNAAPAYSPDGQYIVYNSLRNNDQADLYIMRADGHSTRQLTNNAEPDWQPKWGP